MTTTIKSEVFDPQGQKEKITKIFIDEREDYKELFLSEFGVGQEDETDGDHLMLAVEFADNQVLINGRKVSKIIVQQLINFLSS